MEYKISELCALTNVPKSTVLYYIREGLLPEAKKLKSNVHRYNDEHAELIRYIKYMQNEMGSSIEEIKEILKHKNQSFSSSFSMLAPLMQTLSNIQPDARCFSKAELIEYCDIDTALLDRLLDEGILLPTGEDNFTDREVSMIRLVQRFDEVGVDLTLIKAYVHHARVLSELECRIQESLCRKRTDENFSTLWKIMFETLFNAKPYIFARHTYNALKKVVQKEVLR